MRISTGHSAGGGVAVSVSSEESAGMLQRLSMLDLSVQLASAHKIHSRYEIYFVDITECKTYPQFMARNCGKVTIL
jgi:hypothetical protein